MDKRVILWSVFVSLVSSMLFAWLLDPISRWLWSATADTTSAWINAYVDAAYSNAALGHRNWVAATILILITAILALYPLAYLATTFLRQFAERRLESAPSPVAAAKKTLNILTLISVLFYVWFLFVSARQLFSVFVDLQLNASFSQRLAVIAPHISELEEEKLKAAWALMKNRQDYARINETLETSARQSQVTLPRPLYE